MKRLGPEATAFLKATRRADDPTEADRELVRAAILARLAAGAAGGLAVVSAPSSAAAASGAVGGAGASAASGVTAGLAVKTVVAAALVCGIGVGAAVFASSFAPAVLSATAAAPSPPAEGRDPGPGLFASPPPIDELGRVESRSVASSWPAPLPAPASPRRNPSTPSEVAAEVRLLAGAQTALRDGDAIRALGLLDEHARRFPKGALGEERDAVRIASLCALGRATEARDAADRFLRAAPLSPHAGLVRASCGGPSAMPSTPRF
jgi:hypothetical protein